MARTMLGQTLRLIESEEREANWTEEVRAKWHPIKGLFTRPAKFIASYLKKHSKSLKQAMSRLNFYINRAGKNLGDKDAKNLENAKTELEKLYH